jgi:hypothetical protein
MSQTGAVASTLVDEKSIKPLGDFQRPQQLRWSSLEDSTGYEGNGSQSKQLLLPDFNDGCSKLQAKDTVNLSQVLHVNSRCQCDSTF